MQLASDWPVDPEQPDAHELKVDSQFGPSALAAGWDANTATKTVASPIKFRIILTLRKTGRRVNMGGSLQKEGEQVIDTLDQVSVAVNNAFDLFL
jgi:hypothetical protein